MWPCVLGLLNEILKNYDFGTAGKARTFEQSLDIRSQVLIVMIQSPFNDSTSSCCQTSGPGRH